MTAAARVDVPYPGVPYQRSVPVLTFALHGVVQPQGSKTGFIRGGKVVLVEAVKGLKPWRAAVRLAIEAAMTRTAPPALGWPILGPVAVELIFTMPKPKSAPKLRRTWPIVKPDVSKLARAVEDSATDAGLWGDDSQVVDLHAWKVYPLETPRALRQPGLHATVYLIDPQGPAAGEPARLL